MRKILLNHVLMIVLILFSTVMHAQSTITGQVIDGETGEGLPGASIMIKGTTLGATTDLEGNFELLADPDADLEVSFIGFEPQTIKASEVGSVTLEPTSVGLQEVQVIASFAVDRKTPIAVSTIKKSTITERVGNQEFPEVLRSTPSIYVTKQGGGFGDSRINVRGFDQRNTAVMINGIPVNDMENGWVYWSNWAGLTDVASAVQVQRGLGATKLAVASVGGSINIVTDAAAMKQGGYASFDYGNDNYMKFGLSYNTGLMDNGLALTVQATRTQGDGYADGTLFRAHSYFLSLSKRFNEKHTINFTGLGAPQWHHQREYGSFDGVSIATVEELGIKYNPQWGYYNDSDKKDNEYSWRRNFYHKPKLFLNHYWTMSDKTELSTSLYASLGRGGGTGDLGRINGSFRTSSTFKADNNQVNWNDIRSYNMGNSVPSFGDDQVPWSGPGVSPADQGYNGPFAGQNVAESYRNGMILRSSMNEHNWFGILSNLTTDINDNLTLVAGVDARYYRGLHYRRVEDLMGLDAYFDDDDINEPEKYITDEGRADGNQIDYNNDGLVNWFGLFAQLEYSKNDFSAFLSLSGSNQGFKRIDYFLYEDDDPQQESDWENFLGGTVKAGINYNLNANHNVFVNGGFFSRQPIFDNVFLNFSNTVNEDVENQSVYSFEAGYGFRSSSFTANLNVYHTQWGNRQLSQGSDQIVNDPVEGEIQAEGVTNFTNIQQLHQGIEFDFIYSPIRGFEIRGMASFGNWRYTEDFDAIWTPENPDYQDQQRDITLFMKDVKVPDAAQTTVSVSASYEVIKGLVPYVTYYYADRLYADFDLADDVSFLEEGNQAWELPSYNLIDLGLRYNFALFGLNSTFTVNVNNLFDNEYMSEAESNILFDPSNTEDQEYGNNGSIRNRVYYGFGRTWNTGLKVRF